MTNREIAQEISNRIGNSPVPFDSVYSIALQIYNELGGEETQFDSVYSILLEILPLVASGKDSIVDVDVLPDAELNKGKLVRYEGNLYYAKPEEIKAVKFTALEDSTIGLASKNSGDNFEYSLDSEVWNVLDTSVTISLQAGKSVYIRGICVTGDNIHSNFTMTGKIAASGNINTMLDYTADDLGGNFQLLEGACFDWFMECSALSDVSELYLPSTNLAYSCYRRMFRNTGITSAPALPATTLANYCYYHMFFGCAEMENAPILPAPTLSDYAYGSIIRGCSKINYIKCLATDISADLSTAGAFTKLSATGTFAKASSMNNWIVGNNGIPTGWEIVNDDTIPEYEWHGVYKYNWTELPTKQYVDDAIAAIPQLEAGEGISIINNIISIEPDYLSFKNVGSDTIYVTCINSSNEYPVASDIYSEFDYSFDKKNWTNLTEPIQLDANKSVYFKGKLYQPVDTTVKVLSFKVYSDAELTIAVETGCIEASGDLTSLNEFNKIVPDCGFYQLFGGFKALITAPDILAYEIGAQSCRNLFSGCSNLTKAPVLTATKIGEQGYYQLLRNCTSLVTPPVLPAMDLGSGAYYGLFFGCSNLTKAPALPATSVYFQGYASMFRNCTSLVIPPNILPATDVAYGAYNKMFIGCTSLEYTPLIMISTTPDWKSENITTADGYQYKSDNVMMGQRCTDMFSGCTNLKKVRCYTKKVIDSSSNTDNFKNWLNNVSATGYFYCVSGNNFPEGASGIPTGWTVVEV